jgi:hypothetical protein
MIDNEIITIKKSNHLKEARVKTERKNQSKQNIQ